MSGTLPPTKRTVFVFIEKPPTAARATTTTTATTTTKTMNDFDRVEVVFKSQQRIDSLLATVTALRNVRDLWPGADLRGHALGLRVTDTSRDHRNVQPKWLDKGMLVTDAMQLMVEVCARVRFCRGSSQI